MNSKTVNELPTAKSMYGGGLGVMVIVVGNGHGDQSSNPGTNTLGKSIYSLFTKKQGRLDFLTLVW